ncbi:MAG: hypothetical protein ACI892_001132 [Marinobacter maritimus]|jgi:hypothetical protein
MNPSARVAHSTLFAHKMLVLFDATRKINKIIPDEPISVKIILAKLLYLLLLSRLKIIQLLCCW